MTHPELRDVYLLDRIGVEDLVVTDSGGRAGGVLLDLSAHVHPRGEVSHRRHVLTFDHAVALTHGLITAAAKAFGPAFPVALDDALRCSQGPSK